MCWGSCQNVILSRNVSAIGCAADEALWAPRTHQHCWLNFRPKGPQGYASFSRTERQARVQRVTVSRRRTPDEGGQ
jgi:hypothetical protein